MPSVTSSTVALAFSVALAVACAGQQRPPHQRSPLISETESVQRFESPARWHDHPEQAADLITRRMLPSGDTLFAGSIGRTDLPGGDYETLLKAITETLFSFPDESIVYSGHGPETTLGREKQTNPFVLESLNAKRV